MLPRDTAQAIGYHREASGITVGITSYHRPDFDHDALLVPCLKRCGRRVARNLDADTGICGACWEMTFEILPRKAVA